MNVSAALERRYVYTRCYQVRNTTWRAMKRQRTMRAKYEIRVKERARDALF